MVVKIIVCKYNLYVIFMFKLLFGVNGSGMYFNVLLFKGKENVFFDLNIEMGLMEIVY